MKTIILIGIALAFGYTVNAQGWVAAPGSSDGYAFNPYTMSKMPTNSDGMYISPALLRKVPFHIWPEDHLNNPPAWNIVPAVKGNEDGFYPGPNSYISEPNDDVNYDAMPKMREASSTVQHHKPY